MLAWSRSASTVKNVGVLNDLEAVLHGDQPLSLLDRVIMEFLYATTGGTDQMVVVHPVVQFVDGLARLEVRLLEQSGVLQLRQHPVHSGQPGLMTLLEQQASQSRASALVAARVVQTFPRKLANQTAREELNRCLLKGRWV